MKRTNPEAGGALVQVMVMSIILLTLATGVMRLIFGTHVMTARSKRSDDNKLWVESCMAQKNAVWNGAPCAGAGTDTCNFAADNGPTINITCNAVGVNTQVDYTVTW